MILLCGSIREPLVQAIGVERRSSLGSTSRSLTLHDATLLMYRSQTLLTPTEPRILHYLASQDMVRETDLDTYGANRLTKTLADPS